MIENDNIYLDHAAATPLDERVLAAMLPYFSEKFYNPSSPYAPAVAVKSEYRDAKAAIAREIGAKADEIIMTAGATESINLAINSIGGHIVTSSIEHHSVLEATKAHEHTLIGVDEKGIISLEDLKKSIKSTTKLVSIALANNELGTIQPLKEIAQIIASERESRLEMGNKTPIYFHSDASQGMGFIDVVTSRLGVDLLTLNAGKVYGPKQVGCLWVDRSVQITPQIFGGGQESGLRSGTENVAGTVGMAKAMQLVAKKRKSEMERLSVIRDKMQKQLLETFPDAVISGSKKKRLPNFLHISFPGLDGERLLFALETKGVLLATGSACAANKDTRSHVLEAIGLPDTVADGSLRITLGKLTTEENAVKAVAIITEEVQKEMKRVKR